MSRLLDFEDLEKKKGIKYSPQHIRRLVKAGQFPKPFSFGAGPNAMKHWDEDEIDAYIAAKKRERNTAPAVEAEAA